MSRWSHYGEHFREYREPPALYQLHRLLPADPLLEFICSCLTPSILPIHTSYSLRQQEEFTERQRRLYRRRPSAARVLFTLNGRERASRAENQLYWNTGDFESKIAVTPIVSDSSPSSNPNRGPTDRLEIKGAFQKNDVILLTIVYTPDIMSFRATVQLNNGKTIPQIGLGTWLSKTHEVENSVCQCMRINPHTPTR